MTFYKLMDFFHNRYTNPTVELESIRIKTTDSLLLSQFVIDSYAVVQVEPLIYDVTLLANIDLFLQNLDEENISQHIISCVLHVNTANLNRDVLDEFLLFDCVAFVDEVSIDTLNNKTKITIDFQILITNLEFENFTKELVQLL